MSDPRLRTAQRHSRDVCAVPAPLPSTSSRRRQRTQRRSAAFRRPTPFPAALRPSAAFRTHRHNSASTFQASEAILGNSLHEGRGRRGLYSGGDMGGGGGAEWYSVGNAPTNSPLMSQVITAGVSWCCLIAMNGHENGCQSLGWAVSWLSTASPAGREGAGKWGSHKVLGGRGGQANHKSGIGLPVGSSGRIWLCFW